MSLEQILKAAIKPTVLAAGLIGGILHFSCNAKTPEQIEDKKYTVEFSELEVHVGNNVTPKQAVFEDEKTYRKFANLAADIQEAYKNELEKNGKDAFGQKELYQIIEKTGKNAPYEIITSEQVDRAVYIWQKEGKKAFSIDLPEPEPRLPIVTSEFYNLKKERGCYYIVLGQYGRAWKTKVEDPWEMAAFIDKMERKDPMLKDKDFYNFQELRSLTEAVTVNGEIAKKSLQEAGQMTGLQEILEHSPK